MTKNGNRKISIVCNEIHYYGLRQLQAMDRAIELISRAIIVILGSSASIHIHPTLSGVME
jgi:hypothetical protein